MFLFPLKNLAHNGFIFVNDNLPWFNQVDVWWYCCSYHPLCIATTRCTDSHGAVWCLNHVNTFLFCACFPVAYHYATWQVQRPIPLKIPTRNSNSTDMFSCIWNPDHMRAVYFSTCHNWSVVTRVKLRNNNKNQYVNSWKLCEMSPNYELCTKTPMRRAPANKGAFYSDGSFQIPCVTADWFQNRRKWNQVHIALEQTAMPLGYQYLKSTAIHLIKLRSQRWELFPGGFNQQNY